MKTRTLITIVLLATGFVASPARLPAQETETIAELQEIVGSGLETNLDYAEALRSYNRALRDRDGDAAWESTVLSGIVYSGLDVKDLSSSASLSVPLLDQLSLTSSVTITPEVSGTVGATFHPFADSGTTDLASEEQFLRASIALEATRLSTSYTLEEAVLSYGADDDAVAYAETAMELQEEILDIVTQEYNLGEASYLDVDDARSDLDQARNAWSKAQRTSLTNRQTLASLLALTGDLPEIPTVDTDTLMELVSAKQERLAVLREGGTVAWSTSLEYQKISLEMLEEERAATSLYQPDLALSTSTDTAFQTPTFSLSVSFSPQQWASDELSDLDEEIADARIRVAVEGQMLSLEEEVSRRMIEIAERDYILAQADLADARLSLDETRALLDLGERTSIELRQTELTVESNTQALYKAFLSLNGVLNDGLELYGEGWY